MIPNQLENPKGLHHRYKIKKFDKEEVYFEGRWIDVTLFSEAFPVPDGRRRISYKEVDENAEYFVMRLDTGGKDIEHIKACRVGIHAYADAIMYYLPELAKDLKERYPLLAALEPSEQDNEDGYNKAMDEISSINGY